MSNGEQCQNSDIDCSLQKIAFKTAIMETIPEHEVLNIAFNTTRHCCPSNPIPESHESPLLTLFLSALRDNITTKKDFLDNPQLSWENPVIVFKETIGESAFRRSFHESYFVLIKDLVRDRAWIEMYPAESFKQVKLNEVESWLQKENCWWIKDNITTGERVIWMCKKCDRGYSVRVWRKE
jgi:hypothetical protein